MILPIDLRVRIAAGLGVLLLFAPISGLCAAIVALGVVLALFAVERQPVPWRRLWHLEAFLVLIVLTVPFSMPGTALFHIGPFTASLEGVTRAATIAAKVAASVLFLALIFAGAAPERVGEALRGLHLPEALVRIFLGVVRYLDLIRDEMRRLRETMRLRSFRPRSNWHTWRSYGHLFGMMLLRAMHRAERIEEAMRLRGYCGRFLAPELAAPLRGDRRAALAMLGGAAMLLAWDLL